MVIDNTNTEESSTSEFPEVPDEAIVKPEDERPVKMTKNSEEELPGDENKQTIVLIWMETAVQTRLGSSCAN